MISEWFGETTLVERVMLGVSGLTGAYFVGCLAAGSGSLPLLVLGLAVSISIPPAVRMDVATRRLQSHERLIEGVLDDAPEGEP